MGKRGSERGEDLREITVQGCGEATTSTQGPSPRPEALTCLLSGGCRERSPPGSEWEEEGLVRALRDGESPLTIACILFTVVMRPGSPPPPTVCLCDLGYRGSSDGSPDWLSLRVPPQAWRPFPLRARGGCASLVQFHWDATQPREVTFAAGQRFVPSPVLHSPKCLPDDTCHGVGIGRFT